MRKIIASILSVIMALLLCSAASAADPVLVEEIALDQEEVIVFVGRNISTKATVLPKNASNKKLEWYSSDDSVASVKNGSIKGIANGEAVITVKAADGSNAAASLKVVVATPVKKITLSDKTISLAPDTTHSMGLTIEPEDATFKDVTWTSSNTKVAMVDENGVITGVAKGNANISATSADGSKVKASVSVKVDNYDLVFLDRNSQTVKYGYGSGRFNIKGSVKTGNVSIPVIDEFVMAAIVGGLSYHDVEVTPVSPGTDIVTIKVGSKKFTYTAYVSEEAFSQPDRAPDDSISNAVPLEFSSVSNMKSSELETMDEVYILRTKESKDPGEDSNALSFKLNEPLDCSSFSTFTFYIKDLQGNNTHRVTIIDKDGKTHSEWVDISSEYSKWVRIDAQLRDYEWDIDLKSVAEIRIGEWNEGRYMFDRLCMAP